MIVQGAFNKLFSPGLRKRFEDGLIGIEEEIKAMDELDNMWSGKILTNKYLPAGTAFMFNGEAETGYGITNIADGLLNQGLGATNTISISPADLKSMQNQMMQGMFGGQQQQFGGFAQQHALNNPEKYQALTAKIPAKKNYCWYEKYKQVAVYDYNTDSIVISATGERVTCKAIEDGYKPYLSNTEWLDAKISQVRNYAYAGTLTRDIRQYRV